MSRRRFDFRRSAPLARHPDGNTPAPCRWTASTLTLHRPRAKKVNEQPAVKEPYIARWMRDVAVSDALDARKWRTLPTSISGALFMAEGGVLQQDRDDARPDLRQRRGHYSVSDFVADASPAGGCGGTNVVSAGLACCWHSLQPARFALHRVLTGGQLMGCPCSPLAFADRGR